MIVADVESNSLSAEQIILNEPMAYRSYQEHVGEYAFKNLVRSKIVFDLTCGSGYVTSFFLAAICFD